MKFYKDYRVQYDDCDETKRLKLTTMINMLMEVSEAQLANTLGSAKAMNEQGRGWVVTQYEFHVKRLPKALEAVKAWTDAAGYNRFLCYRDFGMEDIEGNELLTVHSQWVLFDLKLRKMLPTDPDLVKGIGAPKLAKLPRFKRLRPLEAYDSSHVYRVRYYDLDTNHHMNNGRYFDWIVDTLPRDFLNQHVPVRIDLRFDKEVQYGDEAQSWLKFTRTSQEECLSQHLIKVGEDDMALCEIAWRKSL
jgi:medium-chain acyl-[acyl-carrier-protein] hydrolase